MKKTKEIDPGKPPFHYCPRFEKCSANRCPFDPEIGKKATLKGEERCKFAKSRRMKLWEILPEDRRILLPYQGMFKKEFVTWKRWQDMSEEEREAKKTLLRAKIQKGRFASGNQDQTEK